MNEGSKPWLSVVMPVHNGQKWVDRTLASLAYDPLPGIEVVVVDTSSTPETLEIVKSYADRLNLRILEPTKVEGCAAKSNFGVKAARADHIAWLHQDDAWLPGRAAHVRSWIDGQPDAVLHLAPTIIVDGNDVCRGTLRCPLEDDGLPISSKALHERLLVQNFIAPASPVVRRDAWLASGGADVDLWYTCDWDLWLKISRLGDSYYHDVVTAAFRIHGSSLTSLGSSDIASFRSQQQIVLDRHISSLAPVKRELVRTLAEVSMAVNTGLAEAANGTATGLIRALLAILSLGPGKAPRYFRHSRIFERMLPRVRAKLAGVL